MPISRSGRSGKATAVKVIFPTRFLLRMATPENVSALYMRCTDTIPSYDQRHPGSSVGVDGFRRKRHYFRLDHYTP